MSIAIKLIRTKIMHIFHDLSHPLDICNIPKHKRNPVIIILIIFIISSILFYTRSSASNYSTKPIRYYNHVKIQQSHLLPKAISTNRLQYSPQQRHHQRLRNRLNQLQHLNSNNSTNLHKPIKTLHLHITPTQPSLVIIGSTKGGTTTLFNIINTHLKSFYTLSRNISPDLHYWSKCKPCNGTDAYNQGYSVQHIVSKWDVNPNNLCTNSDDRIKCTSNDYMHAIVHDRRRTDIDLYVAERTSGYMKSPWIAKLFAINFPRTILLYSLREKLSQKYSRWHTFRGRDKKTGVNAAFQHDLSVFRTLRFQKILLPFLSVANQSDMVRDKIVVEYLRYPMQNGKLRHVLGDLCPYLNVITFIKVLEMYNIEYGFGILKLIQSEWMFENIMRTAVYLQCIVKIEDSTSENEFNECYGYYMGNMEHKMEILSMESMNELSENSFHKGNAYEYGELGVELFDEIKVYAEICDMRLFELIREDKYKSLTVGTEWNYNRWVDKREKMREQLLRK